MSKFFKIGPTGLGVAIHYYGRDEEGSVIAAAPEYAVEVIGASVAEAQALLREALYVGFESGHFEPKSPHLTNQHTWRAS